ncbi:MAG: caspase family protein [Saprospiraceae bacterium]
MMKTFLSIIAVLLSVSLLGAQKPVLVIPTGHSSGVQVVSSSADGKYFLTLGGDGLAKLWNEAGKELKTFRSPLRSFTSVSLSPNNEHILAISSYTHADAGVLKTSSGELDFVLKGHTSNLICAAYSPEGQWIATGAADSSAILWNARDGSLIRRFKGHQGSIGSLAFSSDGRFLATFSYDKTVKIWETVTGKLLQTIEVCGESGDEIQFSPDGKMISVLCRGMFFAQDRISLWSTETGEKIREIDGYSLCFSPDGKWVCVFRQSTAFVYASESLDGEPFRTIYARFPPMAGPPPTNILKGTFLPDSKGILLNAMHIPEVYDIETGHFKLALKGYSIPVECVSFSPDAKKCLAGSETDLLEMDFTPGTQVKRFKGIQGKVTNARYSPDGQKIVAVTTWCDGVIMDATNGKEIMPLKATPCMDPPPIYTKILEIAPDGQSFMRGHNMGNKDGPPFLSSWQFSDGAIVDSLFFPFDEFEEPREISIAQDGKQIAVLTRSMLLVWDVDTRQWDKIFVSEFGFGPGLFGSGQIAFYEKNKIAVCQRDEIEFWDIQEKKRIGKTSMSAFQLNQKEVTGMDIHGTELMDAAFNHLLCSPDGKWLAAAYGKTIGLLRCREASQPEIVQMFKGHDDTVLKIGFSPDNRWLISASADNTVRIWDVQKSVEVAKIVHLTNDNWVVTTPSGLFDASDDAKKMMYYVVDYEKEKIVLDLEQLQIRYWQPGLLGAIMGLSPYPVKNVGVFDNLKLFPSIEDSTRIESNQLYIKLRERNGGLGKLSLIINGRRLENDLNPLPNRKKDLVIDLKPYIKSRHLRTDTLNTIELEVYESKDDLKSEPYKLYYQAAVNKRGEGSNEEEPIANTCDAPRNLYLIIVGTSLYPQGVDSLPSANEDAVEMARVLSEAGKLLYGDRVHLKLLSTKAGESPSKANIAAAFEAFKTANVCDVLVVFFAGHGSNWGKDGDKSNFYYLTQDITFGKLNDEGVRKAYAISDQELTEWMTKIPAQNQLLILDACNSGQAAINMGGIVARDIDPDNIVAFNLMSGNTGSYVISGSSASGLSFESEVFGHGLLTYSLLKGISGTALVGSKVDVLQLLLESYKRVPELAQSIGAEQRPIIAKPRGNASFFVGKNDGSVKIELPETKPMVIQSFLFEQDTFSDRLGLTKAVNKAFRSNEIKGKLARWFYSDISEHPQGFSVRGVYTQNQDNTVAVKGRLLRGEEWVGKPFEVSGSKDAKALAALILKAVTPGIKVQER